MKAITLWQPWASLVLVGAKPYEFRSWKPPRSLIGQRIAIQAGARKPRYGEMNMLLHRVRDGDGAAPPCLHAEPAATLLGRVLRSLEGFDEVNGRPPFRLPLSAILCTAILGEPKRGDLCAAEFGRTAPAWERGKWEVAYNWGWPLLEIEPVIPHVEARGMQGFWEWHGDVGAAA